jgi:hypothetical protein
MDGGVSWWGFWGWGCRGDDCLLMLEYVGYVADIRISITYPRSPNEPEISDSGWEWMV